MSLILSGTDGLSDVDGTAATPAIRGTDANTGIFFPAADTIAFSEGGVEAARFDSSGNLLVGATSSSAIANKNIDVNGTGDAAFVLRVGGTTTSYLYSTAGQTILGTVGALPITFNPNGSERVRIDSSGRLGIGSTNPSEKLTIETAGTSTTTSILLGARSSGGDSVRLVTTQNSDGTATFNSDAGGNGTAGFIFKNSGSEKARIDSSGNLLVGTTDATPAQSNVAGVAIRPDGISTTGAAAIVINRGSDGIVQSILRSGSLVGSISVTTSATAYNTSSDYRLKNSIAPMTGALAKVALLKPCIYKWNADGSDGEGFIAHELADVCPSAVTGAKDAVDVDGKIKPQGIDVSFLVATLTAAIQEQQALITQLQADVAALKGASA